MSDGKMNLRKIYRLGEEDDGRPLIDLLLELGALYKPQCTNKFCGKEMKLGRLTSREQKWYWNCRKKYRQAKRAAKLCETSFSVRKGTFFANSKLPIATIAGFVCLWVKNVPLGVIAEEVEISSSSSVDWSSFCLEVVVNAIITNQTPIGGPGRTVDIGESKLGKNMYTAGRPWVFGMVERESGKSVLVSIEKRDLGSLVPMIKKWVLPGTHIVSDCEGSHCKLSEEGCKHQSVNHSRNNEDSSYVHESKVEATWGWSNRSIGAARMKYFLPKYMFMKACRLKNEDPFHTFMKMAGQLYPGVREEGPEEEAEASTIETEPANVQL